MPWRERLWRAIEAAPAVTLGDAFWYGLMAGLAWLLFYVLRPSGLAHRKIAPQFPSRRQLGREIFYSLRSLVAFGGMGACLALAGYSGYTRFYGRIERHGWPWFFASIVLAIFIHDAYFYWTHRLMHHRRLFRRFHRVHHLSTSPSPWAAYSFSVLEAFVQAGIAPVVACTIPIHPSAFMAFMIWQISFNVLGHCGYEIFPGWFLNTWIGKFLNTPTHHAMHHESFRANYGLYFNFWDRLLGTNHPQYAERFAAVSGGPSMAPHHGAA
ncbi:MAG TPA: sterol desaturase family protein [Pirellulales bacterium]|nr:sterol desaturase family protein [Pirellulales bacterium]